MNWPEQSSPIRVQISDSFLVDGIAVRIALRNSPTYISVAKINEHGTLNFEPYEVSVSSDPGVTFYLPNDFARALLQALLQHYNGSEDTRTVRADLLHERQRVDKLLGVVSEIAHDALVTAIERD